MTILYAGTLSPFGTCFSRFTSLRELEPGVHGFDTETGLLARVVDKLAVLGELMLKKGYDPHMHEGLDALARVRGLGR